MQPQQLETSLLLKMKAGPLENDCIVASSPDCIVSLMIFSFALTVPDTGVL